MSVITVCIHVTWKVIFLSPSAHRVHELTVRPRLSPPVASHVESPTRITSHAGKFCRDVEGKQYMANVALDRNTGRSGGRVYTSSGPELPGINCMANEQHIYICDEKKSAHHAYIVPVQQSLSQFCRLLALRCGLATSTKNMRKARGDWGSNKTRTDYSVTSSKTMSKKSISQTDWRNNSIAITHWRSRQNPGGFLWIRGHSSWSPIFLNRYIYQSALKNIRATVGTRGE